MGDDDSSETHSNLRTRIKFAVFIALGFLAGILFKSGLWGLVHKIHALKKGCEIAPEELAHTCMTITAVYRISFANFLFFLTFLPFTRKICWCFPIEPLEYIQSRWFLLKGLLWLGYMVVVWFIPSKFYYGYAWVTAFGSGLFILVQLLLLIDFSCSWSDSWIEKEDSKWHYLLFTITMGLFIASLVGVILMFVWFIGGGDHPVCGRNLAFIIITILLSLILLGMTFRFEGASLLPTAVIVAYSTYMCFSALSSGNADPSHQHCNKLFHNGDGNHWTFGIVIGCIFTAVSLIWSSVSAGGRSFVSGDDDEVEDEVENSPASLTFFHIVMILAAMYMAMLLTNWQIAGNWHVGEQTKTASVDSGTTSMWVKIVSQWIANALYGWVMIAPTVCASREF